MALITVEHNYCFVSIFNSRPNKSSKQGPWYFYSPSTGQRTGSINTWGEVKNIPEVLAWWGRAGGRIPATVCQNSILLSTRALQLGVKELRSKRSYKEIWLFKNTYPDPKEHEKTTNKHRLIRNRTDT
jgi:hypothetical protein